MMADSNLVNLSEAARQLGVNKVTIWRWIKKGKIAPVRFLGMPYLTIDQVKAWKEADKQTGR